MGLDVLQSTGLAAFCTALYIIALSFAFQQGVTLVRPPAGFALAAMLIMGYRIWPALAIGSLLAHQIILPESDSRGAIAGLVLADTLEAVIGVYLLRHVLNFHLGINEVRDVLRLFFAAIVSTMVGAAIVTVNYRIWNVHRPDELLQTFIGWWLGGTVSHVSLAPVLLVWYANRPRWPREGKRAIELVVLVTCLLVACEIAFGRWFPFVAPGHPLAFLPFPIVMWAALRFGPVGASLSSAVATFVRDRRGCSGTRYSTFRRYGIRSARDSLRVCDGHYSDGVGHGRRRGGT